MDPGYDFWSKNKGEVMHYLNTSAEGLSADAVLERTKPTQTMQPAIFNDIKLFIGQFTNTITLLLIFAVLLSAVLEEIGESFLIFIILLLSALLGFIQEKRASRAVEKLQSLLLSVVKVKRNATVAEVSIDQVVPGDIILLEAGNIIPADSLILNSRDLYINESTLTGESFPAEKREGVVPADTPLTHRSNSVFRGTSVVSGTALVVAVTTGRETEIGKIQINLSTLGRETAFEKGVNQFGAILIRVALGVAIIIMAINILTGRNPLDSILFALALSLGLAPEMLPAVVTITLSFGAKRLAQKKVIVKKLSSIQNLGAIDIICTDKTGTLTEGKVIIHSYVSPDGNSNELIRQYVYLNAFFESGYPNPVDLAIRENATVDISGYQKFDEVPYDFNRKRLSIVVARDGNHTMITKGALVNILEVCTQVQLSNGSYFPIGQYSSEIHRRYVEFSRQGLRSIGLCYKDVTGDPVINRLDETEMIFMGFVLLHDPPKQNIETELKDLRDKGIKIKIVTGDNALIAENIANRIGIPAHKIITGKELHLLNDEAIIRKVVQIDIFAETEPSQKERIVRALQKNMHVVGYLGDGINDAPALKTADVGISVNNAVDVAKESADMILLEKELSVLSSGILEGRRIYLNTLKYIFITISANFGNMFSMGIGSVILPFFPLLPTQILLTNFLTDIPALAIASDNVDQELLEKPRRWNTPLIRNFMFTFGLISSFFDFLTFAALYFLFQAEGEIFRTGWFIESVITEVIILLVIRTRRSVFRSRIGKVLLISSLLVIATAILLPYLAPSDIIGFVPVPLKIMLAILAIAVIYGWVGEITKKVLFKKMNY